MIKLASLLKEITVNKPSAPTVYKPIPENIINKIGYETTFNME